VVAAGVVAEPERRSDVCESTLLHLPGIEPPSSDGQGRPYPFSPYKFRVRRCEVCGVLYRPTYGAQRTCSRSCGLFLRWTAAGKPLSMPRLHGQHTDVMFCSICGRATERRSACSYCRRHSAQEINAWRWTEHLSSRPAISCGDCGAEMRDWSGRRYCTACSDKRARLAEHARRVECGASHRARCRFYGVPYDRSLKRSRVFRRDGYRCHICGRKTLPGTHWSHPRHPTVDCLVPLSVPGSPGYVYENVACACFRCNSVKSAGVGGDGDQLLLIG